MRFRIDGSAAWTGAELATRTDWIHVLTPAEIADVGRVVALVRVLATPREKLTREDVGFDALAPTIAALKKGTRARTRLPFVRGLPVERIGFEDSVPYWAFGLHRGIPCRRT